MANIREQTDRESQKKHCALLHTSTVSNRFCKIILGNKFLPSISRLKKKSQWISYSNIKLLCLNVLFFILVLSTRDDNPTQLM